MFYRVKLSGLPIILPARDQRRRSSEKRQLFISNPRKICYHKTSHPSLCHGRARLRPPRFRGQQTERRIMLIYQIGLVVVIAACIFGVIYMTGAVGKFGLIRKVSGQRKWVRCGISFALLLGLFLLFTFLMTVFDAVIIFLHVLFFFLIFDAVFRLIGKKEKEPPKVFWQGWLALAAAAVCLICGYFQCVHVWKTEYTLATDKTVGEVRIALLSDSHVGATFDGDGFASYIEEIMKQEPDLILIPGDFVDDDTTRADMLTACEALGKADPKYGIWFSYGNHDKGYGLRRDFSAEDLARALEENGVHILEDAAAYTGDLCLIGRKDASARSRRELAELLEGAEPGKYVIVLDHEPNDYDKEAATEADLVVSGHTHGGQLIPLGLIGRLFGGIDRTYGYEKRSGTDFIVTSGISNWAVHFKTGTRSEYVIITVRGK